MFNFRLFSFICLLLQLYSVRCQDCRIFPERPLGMTDRFNGIVDEQISATSKYSADTAAQYARLFYSDAFLWDADLPGAGAWSPLDQNTDQSIQVDLKDRKVIVGIATQGRQGSREFVNNYYMDYSEGVTPDLWILYRDQYGQPYLFDGNIDDNTVKYNKFSYPLVARHIRIRPQRWQKMISLRFELFGCKYVPWVASFDGNSRIDFRLDLPGRGIQTNFDEIQFRFKTSSTDGLILYGASSEGDYIAIEIFRTRLRLKLNLGFYSNLAPESMDNLLEAGSMLDDNQWHDVKIIRREKDVNITLDRVKMWRNITADFIHLNLNQNLSIGGISNFAGKRGLSVTTNFVGCMEEFIFNGMHLIRDSRRLLNMAQNQNTSWYKVLNYPPLINSIWWGPQIQEGQIGLTNFVTVGSVGSTCPPPTALLDVWMFPFMDSSGVKIQFSMEGLQDVKFSCNFRTFSRGGTLFYHTVSTSSYDFFIYLGINANTGYLDVQITLDGVAPISYSMKNIIITSPDGSFADGMWHSVSLSVSTNMVVLVADASTYTTVQYFTKPLSLGTVFYIGGGRPTGLSYQGCIKNILINTAVVKQSNAVFDSAIITGTCPIIDRCTPNPCRNEAPCSQDGKTFYCNCSLTGYGGEVCYQSEYPTSCSEIAYRFAGLQSRRPQKIDLDGSGVLPPFDVICDFTTENVVLTEVHHNAENDTLVEGYSSPGSFRLPLVYNTATRDALSELSRRASHCEQSINYKCFGAMLLKRRGGGGTTIYDKASSWWVGRRGQSLFYWGGGIPGLQMCACGVTGTCSGDSRTCNCDGTATSHYISQTDQGLLTEKDDLPVTEVRVGDTTFMADPNGQYVNVSVGPLRCIGDSLFDNTITFRKTDTVLKLPPIFAEEEFDLIFLMRTTIYNGVIMQSVSSSNNQFFEVRIREGNALRFTFDVGYGVQIVEQQTSNWINDDKWHTVKFERNRKQSRLIFDDYTGVTHEEDPDRPYITFNFDSPLYVGSSQASTDGFLGCLSNLIINGRVQDLRGSITDMYGLSLGCQPKCASKPCMNRGECYEMYSTYYCECGLTPYRGFICGREVGSTFLDGSAIKITLDTGNDIIGTLEEYIEIGFKTKDKQGTLLQISSDDYKEYIIIKVNNNGGITIEFDVGFTRYEIATDYIVDLTNDQHHTVRAWRSNMGQQWNIQVDDYYIYQKSFSQFLSKNSDTRLDRPKYLYIGRNFSMSVDQGFTGCLYRMQFNNIFPIKMVFNNEHMYNVEVQGTGIRENTCGYEEIMPPTDPVEVKKFDPVPMLNVTAPIPDWQKQAIIVGVVLGIIFLTIFILLIVFFRNFTVSKGDYYTREEKGADQMDTADNAIRYGKTGQPDVTGKEWWI